jgi:hypothetical protein
MRTNHFSIDIQMPVKQGSAIRGDVLWRLSHQDVLTRIYVNAGEDLIFSTENERMMLQLTSTSARRQRNLEVNIKVGEKRNEMRECGNSEYVYLADADVLLPQRPVLPSMVDGFLRHPQLGAIGVPYQRGTHVACGSMLLKRDFLETHEFRGAGGSCICRNLADKLEARGLYVVPLQTVRAVHLPAESEPALQEVVAKVSANGDEVSDDGLLNRAFLEHLFKAYGVRFKLFIQ